MEWACASDGAVGGVCGELSVVQCWKQGGTRVRARERARMRERDRARGGREGRGEWAGTGRDSGLRRGR